MISNPQHFCVNLVRVDEPDGLFYKVYVTDESDSIIKQNQILNSDYEESVHYAYNLYCHYRRSFPDGQIDSYIEAPFYSDAQTVAYNTNSFELPNLKMVSEFYRNLIEEFAGYDLDSYDSNWAFRDIVVRHKLNLWQENQLYKALLAAKIVNNDKQTQKA